MTTNCRVEMKITNFLMRINIEITRSWGEANRMTGTVQQRENDTMANFE